MAPHTALQDASQKFWLDKTNANHRYAGEEWFKKYADEILAYLPHGGTLLDIGCGSCQVTAYLAGAFDQIVAIDSSPAMIAAARERIAKLGIRNISVASGSAFELAGLVKNQPDVMLSYALVQYFTKRDLLRHLQECKKVLSNAGVICVGLVPDTAKRERYFGYLIPMSSRIRRLPPRIAYLYLRVMGLLRRDPLWDGIGNWFSKTEFDRLAKEANLQVEFCDAAYSDYRFHAILRRAT